MEPWPTNPSLAGLMARPTLKLPFSTDARNRRSHEQVHIIGKTPDPTLTRCLRRRGLSPHDDNQLGLLTRALPLITPGALVRNSVSGKFLASWPENPQSS